MKEISAERLQELSDEYVAEAQHQGIESVEQAHLVEKHTLAVKALMRDFFLYVSIVENL